MIHFHVSNFNVCLYETLEMKERYEQVPIRSIYFIADNQTCSLLSNVSIYMFDKC